jgi:hypothetical protein
VRLMLRVIPVLVFGALLCFAPRVSGQNPDMLMPDESAAKAKQILQQLIDALGGQTYLRVRESVCTGRLSQFGGRGDTKDSQFDYGYVSFADFWKYPDRNRTEYEIKGSHVLGFVLHGDLPHGGGKVVDVYAGDKGWTLDKGGVQEQPAGAVEDFQEQVKTDFDNLLRFRLKEEGLVFRYGGSDLVDLKMVDWIEIADRDQRTFRIAVDRNTHLPLRMVVVRRNEMTHERTEEVSIFANFQLAEGVEVPMQMTREANGRRKFEVFFSECKFNTGLSDAMFTKASLEQRYAETGKKDKKDKRDKNEKSDQKN